MNLNQLLRFCACVLCGYAVMQSNFARAAETVSLTPGQLTEIEFQDADLPPTLYSVIHETAVRPCLTVRLPEDYNPTNQYPLLVYVPGNDGGAKGNIHNAETMAGPRGWIVATLPLFKKSVDKTELGGGVLVGLEDYPAVSKAYRIILGRLFEQISNIDRQKSTMVGFSNGAITLGVLASCHDEFVLTHFKNFCLVDHGMFHLSDLHKSLARDCRFLILVGDQEGLGRELKIRQSQLQQDAWRLLKVNVSYRVLKNTGHEFKEPQMAIVTEWLQNEVVKGQDPR